VEIVRLEPGRVGEASAMLARAFHDDPAWTWLIPDEKRRTRVLPWLFRVGFDVTSADVWATEGAVLGAARWLPPGPPSMRVAATLRAMLATPLRLGAATGPFLAYGRAVESMREAVMPAPHWYLAGIGVEPTHRRRGLGSALLRPGLEAADRDQVPVVLLTNNPDNLPFYEQHGFAVVREGVTPRDGPKAWAMVRSP
jgi:ribosomal protein S18 acetylase RimI-like enzyme